MFRSRALLNAVKKPASNKEHFIRNWLSDSATYPIIGILVGAVSLTTFASLRAVTRHPDITWDKEERSSYIRDNDDHAERHHEHFIRTKVREGISSQVMPGVNNLMVSTKVKN